MLSVFDVPMIPGLPIPGPSKVRPTDGPRKVRNLQACRVAGVPEDLIAEAASVWGFLSEHRLGADDGLLLALAETWAASTGWFDALDRVHLSPQTAGAIETELQPLIEQWSPQTPRTHRLPMLDELREHRVAACVSARFAARNLSEGSPTARLVLASINPDHASGPLGGYDQLQRIRVDGYSVFAIAREFTDLLEGLDQAGLPELDCAHHPPHRRL